jgi:propanediol utilization protein
MHEKMIDINALRLPVRMAGDIEPVPGGVLLPTEVEEGAGGVRDVGT